MADYLLLQRQHDELRAAVDKKLRQHCENNGVDYQSIVGAPRPGAIAQDLLLNEVYDLEAQNRLLEALLKTDDGSGAVGTGGDTPIEQLAGVGPDLAAKLRGQGFETVESVRDAEIDELQQTPGVGDSKAKQLKEAASGGA